MSIRANASGGKPSGAKKNSYSKQYHKGKNDKPSRLSLTGSSKNRSRSPRVHVASPGNASAIGVGILPSPRFVAGFFTKLAVLIVAATVLAGVSVGLLAGYRWLTTIQYFSLDSIDVQGLHRLSNKDIISLSGLAPGDNLMAIKLGAVETAVETEPWVDTVAIKRVFPDTINLVVTERVPAYWMQYQNKLYYADEAGRIIDVVEPDNFESLPQLEIEAGMEKHLDMLNHFWEAAKATGAPFSKDNVAWVRLSWRHGIEIMLLDRNTMLCLGLDNWRDNLRRLTLVWADLMRRGEIERAAVIASQDDKVFVQSRT
ncbi:cell division protein FtsQ/DivIB [Desulfovibrio inopinatus]|uniref:cell division protein FtsQ/DivIB n=1 Tax=Desulfovibrio inopinatus TaxID=102109 RepID=UPI0004162092|nr:FtsQ-type POTRA domain-containing protein [Desulfovibrio inopinatus]